MQNTKPSFGPSALACPQLHRSSWEWWLWFNKNDGFRLPGNLPPQKIRQVTYSSYHATGSPLGNKGSHQLVLHTGDNKLRKIYNHPNSDEDFWGDGNSFSSFEGFSNIEKTRKPLLPYRSFLRNNRPPAKEWMILTGHMSSLIHFRQQYSLILSVVVIFLDGTFRLAPLHRCLSKRLGSITSTGINKWNMDNIRKIPAHQHLGIPSNLSRPPPLRRDITRQLMCSWTMPQHHHIWPRKGAWLWEHSVQKLKRS